MICTVAIHYEGGFAVVHCVTLRLKRSAKEGPNTFTYQHHDIYIDVLSDDVGLMLCNWRKGRIIDSLASVRTESTW